MSPHYALIGKAATGWPVLLWFARRTKPNGAAGREQSACGTTDVLEVAATSLAFGTKHPAYSPPRFGFPVHASRKSDSPAG